MRIYPDTNVLVSALMGHGLCADLLDRIVMEHTVVLGAPVADELHRILTLKFHVPKKLWRELAVQLQEFELAESRQENLDIQIDDQSDIAVLSAAVSANVDLIVTGDRELIDLGRVNGIEIVSPRVCWDRLIS